jgi:hypothetical protein
MIIGINGKARSGKDTVADFLVPNHMVKVSFADPLKRVCMDLYSFSIEQLWGDLKEKPDPRYPREHGRFVLVEHDGGVVGKCACCGTQNGNDPCYLTPRFAMQILGTEFGRVCYPNTWVDYLLRVAGALLRKDLDVDYLPWRGLFNRTRTDSGYKGVLVPDMRFENEIVGLKAVGAKLVRVKRPGAGLKGGAAKHKSETEQDKIPDSSFDVVIDNSGTLEELELKVERAIMQISYVPTQEEIDEAREAVGMPGTATHVFYQQIAGARALDAVAEAAGQYIKSRLDEAALETNAVEDGLNQQALEDALKENPTMQRLLDQRAVDIKAGKLLEYDEAQKDVPPMLRKPKKP